MVMGRGGFGGWGAQRRSSFMFNIVHKLFRPLGVAAMGRLHDELACLTPGLDDHF